MEIFALQGDQIIRKCAPVAGKLESVTNLVIAGSHTSPHTIRGKVQTRVEGDVRFVVVPRATTIDHADRHNQTKLPKGSYSISPQRERGGTGDRAVED
jgi:hypothetical protein